MFFTPDKKPLSAFSLIEVTIAMSLVAVMGLTLIALLGRANDSVHENRSRDDARLIQETIRMRIRDRGFGGMFSYTHQTSPPPVYIYSYHGDLKERRDDGTDVPVQGREYRIAHGFRTASDPLFKEDLETREGDVYRLRVTPYDPKTGGRASIPADPINYPDPALHLFVEVYRDFTPGEKLDEWPEKRKFLSFPIMLLR